MTASPHAHGAPAHDHSAPAHDHGAAAHGHDHAASPDDTMTSLLDLDGEVLHDYWSAALDWVAAAASAAGRAGRLLDLGAGTGTGALGLAERFPRAEVIAVDVEPGSLARLRDKARSRGLAGRVRAVEADLDAGWPDLGLLDLTWASMSLHHLADPGRVLADALAATRPGGLIAAAEFAEPLRFLRPEAVPPGFEDRLFDRLGRAHAEALPTLGSAWAPRLAGAGWEVAGEREFPVDLDPPSHPRAAEYARAWFARLSQGLADQLEPADQATLAALLAGDGPLSASDLRIRGIRTVTLARRPR
jgi:SAM-dependent methyltransferase